MTQDARQYDLVLFGATGYTGKLTAEWISTHLPTDLKWAIAGRSASKLQIIVDDLRKLSPDRKQPVVETCELHKDQLAILARKTRLLITTVGPYMFYGEPVLAACAEHGTHYLDCTGEVPWYQDMVEKYHETANRSGAIIIPQCGLDSVPADIMSFALATYIRKTLNAPTTYIAYSFRAGKSGVSGGTASTVVNMFSHYPLAKLAAAMKPYSLSPIRPTNPSKPPASSLLYTLLGLKYIQELGGVQTIGPMASVDACMVHRSWGLYESTARDTDRKEVSYGPKFRFVEYMRSKSIISGALIKLGFALFGLLMALPPSRWVLTPLIKKFIIPAPGEGPTKEQMKNDFLYYQALAIADTEHKEKVIGSLKVAHGGYGTTGLTLSAAADVILRGDLATTEAGKLGGGILTPATLGEPYVEKLREFGMEIDVGLQ
ncbi:Saccharopine dehydrogenase-domain-containing protein [Lophiotrema nucula]|uniref:Saccharopine dehydrogenase-domain-containing protein n=1 Tax=Lophiotrema nucula TaxID=690887 RepID=A0A6A5YIY5_9PLEO|nr:Saccharopine dehydrogenase-domain-containing protein [Lophiotrema nucula]